MSVSRRINQAMVDRIMLGRKRNNNIVLRVVTMLNRGELEFEEVTLVERERIEAEVVLKSCLRDLEKIVLDMENVSISIAFYDPYSKVNFSAAISSRYSSV
jgi:hypothetical protein